MRVSTVIFLAWKLDNKSCAYMMSMDVNNKNNRFFAILQFSNTVTYFIKWIDIDISVNQKKKKKIAAEIVHCLCLLAVSLYFIFIYIWNSAYRPSGMSNTKKRRTHQNVKNEMQRKKKKRIGDGAMCAMCMRFRAYTQYLLIFTIRTNYDQKLECKKKEKWIESTINANTFQKKKSCQNYM